LGRARVDDEEAAVNQVPLPNGDTAVEMDYMCARKLEVAALSRYMKWQSF